MLFGLKKDVSKILSALEHSNLNQLKVLVRIFDSAGRGEVSLCSFKEREKLREHKDDVRAVIRGGKELIAGKREPLLQALIPLASALHIVLAPIFIPAEHVSAQTSSSSEGDSNSDSDSAAESDEAKKGSELLPLPAKYTKKAKKGRKRTAVEAVGTVKKEQSPSPDCAQHGQVLNPDADAS